MTNTTFQELCKAVRKVEQTEKPPEGDVIPIEFEIDDKAKSYEYVAKTASEWILFYMQVCGETSKLTSKQMDTVVHWVQDHSDTSEFCRKSFVAQAYIEMYTTPYNHKTVKYWIDMAEEKYQGSGTLQRPLIGEKIEDTVMLSYMLAKHLKNQQ